jgi:hypothetical protein
MKILIFTNIFILFLSFFAIFTVALFYFDIYVIFPFTLVESKEIPYNNLIGIRLAIFATFGFYGIMHLLHGSKEVYPVHFLKTFLFMLSIIGLTVFIKGNAEVTLKQWMLCLFFFIVATILHLASDSKKRRFGKK